MISGYTAFAQLTTYPARIVWCYTRLRQAAGADSSSFVFSPAGKLSGQAAVTSRLKGLGYTLTKEQMADIFIRFKVRCSWHPLFCVVLPCLMASNQAQHVGCVLLA